MRLLSVYVVILALVNAHGAKILGVFPYCAKSHSIMTNAIVKELLNRGHQVDVIAAHLLPPNTPNYTAIDVSPGYDYWPDLRKALGLTTSKDMSSCSFWDYKKAFSLIGYGTTEYALKHPNVQQFLHTKSHHQHYDLVLVEEFYQDALLMLSHQFQAPIVSISTNGWNNFFDTIFGSFGAWAHVPHELFVFPDKMTFWQRFQNAYFCLCDKYYRYYEYLPLQQALADMYFDYLPVPHPSIEELSRSAAVILQNTHVPMKTIKPNVPGVVDVGGIHITPAQGLPEDLQSFLDGATQGAIYFSFGSQVLSTDIPAEQMSAFMKVFKEFSNVRVLWKFESANADQLPKNVLPRKWLPQNDILAHPNVKVFITHSGLLGSQEGLYHGVPMLGIPFYSDQEININRAEVQGYGIKLHMKNITVENLRWAISELLHNPSYSAKVKEYSSMFRERPESAMDTAMFWIEYVIKFRGADHLRSAGRDLDWFSYLLLDIVGVVILSVVFLVVGCWLVIKGLLSKIKQAQTTSQIKITYKNR